MRVMRETSRHTGGVGTALPAHGFAGKWAQLHKRADELAKMAQLSPERFEGSLAAFPNRTSEAHHAQRERVCQGLDDSEAMMTPGLIALETLRGRGAATTAPALALWREFYSARNAVMALAEG